MFGGVAMRYEAAGKQIICSHCGGDTFAKDYRLLNTKGASFFNFDWANRDAIILVCHDCSHIEWFYEEPEDYQG